jgi:hypothetical protein
MKLEEKLMTLQMLGTLLEKTIMKTKYELDGTIKYPAMPVPILETSERQLVLDKIKEIIKSIETVASDKTVFTEAFEKVADKINKSLPHSGTEDTKVNNVV